MFNVNGPPKGFNVTSDQSSYDLVSRDIIVCSINGTPNTGSASGLNSSYSFNLGTDNINQIYKAELISATIAFGNETLPTNVKNNTLILSIPQMNQNTFNVASNTSGVGSSNEGNNPVQSQIFGQIPDNSTPITPGGVTTPNGIISLLIGARMFDTVQFYNPPLSKVNKIDVQWFDTLGNPVYVSSSVADGVITTFYFTLRVYYFQKRNNTSSFSTSVFNYGASGTIDSIFQPYQN